MPRTRRTRDRELFRANWSRGTRKDRPCRKERNFGTTSTNSCSARMRGCRCRGYCFLTNQSSTWFLKSFTRSDIFMGHVSFVDVNTSFLFLNQSFTGTFGRSKLVREVCLIYKLWLKVNFVRVFNLFLRASFTGLPKGGECPGPSFVGTT